ncbi:MAG: alpha-E domain-containing protein, partial [Chloroflexota bacterium]
ETSQRIAAITQSTRNRRLSRHTGRLRSLLEFGQIDEIMNTGLDLFLSDVQTLNNQIHESIYQVYISFPVVEELPVS